MAALGLHRVALLGTSLGGILGMALGTLRPGVLAGLALNDTGPVLQQGGLAAIGDIIGRDPGFGTLEDAVDYLGPPATPRHHRGGLARRRRAHLRAQARTGAGTRAGTSASSTSC